VNPFLQLGLDLQQALFVVAFLKDFLTITESMGRISIHQP
jgi:hypothetical protein